MAFAAFARDEGDFESGHVNGPDSPSGEMVFWNIVEVGVVRKWSASKPLDDDVGSNGSCNCPGDPSPLPSGFADLSRTDYTTYEHVNVISRHIFPVLNHSNI